MNIIPFVEKSTARTQGTALYNALLSWMVGSPLTNERNMAAVKTNMETPNVYANIADVPAVPDPRREGRSI